MSLSRCVRHARARTGECACAHTQCGMARRSMAQCSTAWHGEAQHGAAQQIIDMRTGMRTDIRSDMRMDHAHAGILEARAIFQKKKLPSRPAEKKASG